MKLIFRLFPPGFPNGKCLRCEHFAGNLTCHKNVFQFKKRLLDHCWLYKLGPIGYTGSTGVAGTTGVSGFLGPTGTVGPLARGDL